MRPEAFLETADALLTLETLEEHDARTACGRAYYALAITVRDRVCAVAALTLQHTETHAFVAKWLARASVEQNLAKAWTKFKVLRRSRGDADYEMAVTGTWGRETVEQRIDDARAALASFNVGFSRLTREVVKATANSALDDVIGGRRA